MPLNDLDILELCEQAQMISPYHPCLLRAIDGIQAISFGLSSFGYDITLSRKEFRIFRRLPGEVVDPKNFTLDHLEWSPLQHDRQGSFFILPAHSYALAVSLERFNMPADVLAICVGKSTYARAGVIVNVTPLEPGWTGHLTIEISNSSDSDVRVYANEGIAQLIFHRGNPPATTYADRSGKYQHQKHQITLAKV
jgi:dCTP deaminase